MKLMLLILSFSGLNYAQGGFFDYTEVDDPIPFLWNRNPFYGSRDNKCTGLRIDGTKADGVCLSRPECFASKGEATSPSPTDSNRCTGFLRTCCVTAGTCSKSSKSKVSHFRYTSGLENEETDCEYQVELLNENVCQIKVDFESLKLSPATVVEGSMPAKHTCQNDYFEVYNHPTIPILCGDNSKQQIYVHLDQRYGTRRVTFRVHLKNRNSNPTLTKPDWNVKFTQLECPSNYNFFSKQKSSAAEDFRYLAPIGCTQYYIENFGTVKSLSYDGEFTPVNRYSICFKRRARDCSIEYTSQEFTFPDDKVTDETCKNYLFIPGKEDNTKPVAKYCTFPPKSTATSHSPGPFYVYVSNPDGNGKFKIDYKINSNCERIGSSK